MITEIVVGKVIGNFKNCKAADISGWCNSRLKAITSTPEGPSAFVAWVRKWVSGAVSQNMVQPWRSVLGIPLRKGEDGERVRPILVGETLIALPRACLQHVALSKATKLLAPIQLGLE